jgi:glutathione S-transferase
MTTTVYGAPLSPFVRKVRATLLEKGIDYHLEVILPYAPPEGYEQLNPLKRIPAFQDDDATLADSAVICHYLEHKYPTPALMPASAASRARCEWLEKYADYELFPVTTQTLFWETLIKPVSGGETDHAKIAQAQDELLPPLLDYLQSQLGSAKWFVDNQFSLADIAICGQLINMAHAGFKLDAERWPTIAAFLERCLQRESLAALVAEERKQVEKILAHLAK